MITRRAALGLGLAALATARSVLADVPKARRPLDLLFLGGTGFLGPHQVGYALARGHRVTLFNRGRAANSIYDARVEVLHGDRDTRVGDGLMALADRRRWDAVIDNSGYLPRHVQDSAELLKGRIGRYLFVSTMSVYDRTRPGVIDEASPLQPLPDPENERDEPGRYGPTKAECDRIVRRVYGARATVVRPTFILGPGDDTDRLAYWLTRVGASGVVAGPRADAAPLQWVDVRDLCPWMITLVERDVGGALNAAAPPTEWNDVLGAMRAAAGVAVDVRRPPGTAVQELGVNQPLVRADDPKVRLDGRLATRRGLVYRPIDDTVRSTWDWWRQQTPERRAAARGWPTSEQERALLTRSA